MTWQPPTPAGANFLSQHDTEQQQYEQLTSNMTSSSSAIPGGHAPTTSGGIPGEYGFNTPYSGHQGPTTLTPQHLAGSSSAGPSNDASAGWFDAPRVYQQSPQGQGSGHKQAGGGLGGSGSGSGITPSKSMLETRRSLQARGKNYHFGAAGPQGKDWEERQRRDEAISILESEEMLMWIAGVRNESIPQTRAHYRNVVLGLTKWEKDAVAWRDEWEVEGSGGGSAEGQSMAGGSPARSAKGKERDIAKMRKRVSSGQGHG
ncbi:hypothetical protein AA0120_g8275 [Alternaria tenuissima]|nr:hypothetical protein AA0120_g8275 [Alternaria tenuissima]